jgi:hypothetical protein
MLLIFLILLLLLLLFFFYLGCVLEGVDFIWIWKAVKNGGVERLGMSFFFSEGILGISLSVWPHGSHVLHMIIFSVTFDSNLDGRGYEGAILPNWGGKLLQSKVWRGD